MFVRASTHAKIALVDILSIMQQIIRPLLGPLFFISLGVLLSTAFFSPPISFPAALPPAAKLPTFVRAPRNIYFDIGANNGDSITEFLAARSALTWDVVLIEATPRFTAQLKELCARATQQGTARSCLPLVETALTIYDGFVDIFVEEQRKEHDASSIVASANVARGAGAHFNATAVDVVTLFRTIFPVHETDYVVVKIDIEGAEFPVVTRAIFHGLVPLWDEMFVEWHDGNPFIFGGAEQAKYERQKQCLQNVLAEGGGLHVQAWT